MALNQDKFSKPSQGRFFPLSAPEIVARLVEARFQVHEYHARLPLLLENCEAECKLGYQLASFHRMGYLAVFSLPAGVHPSGASCALLHAISEFAAIDGRPLLATREQQFVIYRAYFGPLNSVSVTQHVVSGVSRAYLQFRKASQLSKSQGAPKHETLLSQVSVA